MTVFYVGFVLGIVAIPILYWLFGPGEAGGARNEDVRGERQRRGEERGGSVEGTE